MKLPYDWFPTLDEDEAYAYKILEQLGKLKRNIDYLNVVRQVMSTARSLVALNNMHVYFDRFSTTTIAEDSEITPKSIGRAGNLAPVLGEHYVVTEVNPDGHCFFRAVNQLVNGTQNEIYSLRFLALSVAIHDDFWDKCSEYFGERQLETVRKCTLLFDQYRNISEDCWADECVVQCVANALQWNIQVFPEQRISNSAQSLYEFQQTGLVQVHLYERFCSDLPPRKSTNYRRLHRINIVHSVSHYSPMLRKNITSAAIYMQAEYSGHGPLSVGVSNWHEPRQEARRMTSEGRRGTNIKLFQYSLTLIFCV